LKEETEETKEPEESPPLPRLRRAGEEKQLILGFFGLLGFFLRLADDTDQP